MSAQPIHSDSMPDSQPLLVQIACNVCRAKYSVGVDKIAGRAVKMRCKQCSAVLVMRGDAATVAKAHDVAVQQTGERAPQDEPSGEQPMLEAVEASGAPANVTGARNESSVLFTLDKLRGITATNDIAKAAAASPDQLILASGSSSGLIDMKALSSEGGSMMVMSRVRVESDRPQAFSQYKVFGLAFGASVLVASGAAAAIFFAMTNTDQIAPPSAAAHVALLPAAAVHPIGEPPAAHAARPANVEQSPAAVAAPAGPEAPAVVAAAEASEERPTSHVRGRRGRRAHAARVAPARAAQADTSLESLMASNARTAGRAAPARAAAAHGSSLPEAPSADNVRSAMNAVRSAAHSCGGAQHGTASALVGVSGANGHVSSVSVVGASSSVRSCLERAVRRAHFARFQRPTFSFRYPLQF
ncbi:MAG: hypothetical protein IPK60_03175 [Sandaracinaceae bacterium]|nr:hypothetical protein [Sandaracinaceae bacterium]